MAKKKNNRNSNNSNMDNVSDQIPPSSPSMDKTTTDSHDKRVKQTSEKTSKTKSVDAATWKTKSVDAATWKTKSPAPVTASSHTYMWLVCISITVVVAAVVYTNEDVQMFLVKFHPLASNPLSIIVPATSEETTSHNQQSHKHAQQHSADRDSEKKHQTKDARKDKNGDPHKQSNDRDTSSSKRETKIESDNIKDTSASVSEMTTSETKSETKIVDSVSSDSETTASDTKATPGESVKSKRDSYELSNITSKGDFKIRKKLDAADKLLEQGKMDKALEKFDTILKDHSKSPRALWGKALAMDKLAEKERSNAFLEEAIGLMDRVMKLNNTPMPLLLMVGDKLADRQSFRGWSHKEADTWKYLIDKYPSNLIFQNKLGVSYLKMGTNDQAKEVFQKVLEQDAGNGFALVHLGFIYKITDLNNEEAIPLMQRGIDTQEPGTIDGRFFYHLGDAYLRVNNTDMARTIYERGAELGLFQSAEQRSLYNADTPLTGRPWWTKKQTTYQKHLELLEDNWKTIRDEGLAQLDMKKGSFIPEEENLRETGDWKQSTLYQRGQKNKENCRKVPKTCALLDKIPDAWGCTRGQVKYSVMHPGVHVWPHTGPTNCRLRAHLGLKIPEGPRIRVGNDTRTWMEGKFIIFDDSFEHEVWHEGTELRLVLIVDFWHPELPNHERRSLSPI